MPEALKVVDFDPGNLDMEPEPLTPPAEAVIPPRPSDLRSKEGRAWKKQYGNSLPEAVSLTSDKETTRLPKTKRSEHFKRILLSFHAKMALATADPTLALDDSEAEELANSFVALLSYYHIKLDGKRGAQWGVLYAVSIVYGPRLFALLLPRIMAKLFPNKENETT